MATVQSNEPAGNLVIDVSIDADGWNDALGDSEDIATQAILAVWRAVCEKGIIASALCNSPSVEVSLVLLNDDRQQILNRDYRGIDKPTNVLSFATGPLPNGPALEGMPWLLGDISIALETTQAEAKSQKKTMANHFSHLVVHGMVHLIGLDHVDAAEAEIMENLETEILKGLGIENPYA